MSRIAYEYETKMFDFGFPEEVTMFNRYFQDGWEVLFSERFGADKLLVTFCREV